MSTQPATDPILNNKHKLESTLRKLYSRTLNKESYAIPVTHFKGGLYYITKVTEFVDTNTPEFAVTYMSHYTKVEYTRTVINFNSIVRDSSENLINRFTLLSREQLKTTFTK